MEARGSKSKIFVFSYPPSASSLLRRVLEKHPQLDVSDNPFQGAYTVGPEKVERHDHGDAQHLEARRKASPDETYQKAFDRLQKSIARAEKEDKRLLFTEDAHVISRPDITSANIEHDPPLFTIPTPVIMTSKTMPTRYRCPLRASNSARSSDSPLFTATFPIFHPITEGLGIHTIEYRFPNANPTILPDAFLKSVTPICVIGHPARTVPSLYRTAHLNVHGAEFAVRASLRWCRLLFDWYIAATARKPIVLNDEDLVYEYATMKGLCDALALDESGVQSDWDAVSQSETREYDIRGPPTLPTIQTRNRVERSRKRDDKVDIDKEAKEWVKAFGEDAAEVIKRTVLGATDDYAYLRHYAMA